VCPVSGADQYFTLPSPNERTNDIAGQAFHTPDSGETYDDYKMGVVQDKI
jgi:hypothetical protein